MTIRCRFCGADVVDTVANLGLSPLSNHYIATDQAHEAEVYYPLHAYVCRSCFLVQLKDFQTPEHIFTDYLYFSSYSQSWLQHCETYARDVTRRLGLGPTSQVIEVASNDGYMLKFFRQAGVRVLGVEPANNVAQVAIAAGVPTDVAFFGAETARRLRAEGHLADLMIANNVLAHVPDINDFVAGFAILLKDDGVVTFEFPHLLNMIRYRQFDTIYHEHFSYLSAFTVSQVLEAHGMRVFDVEALPTHGGSLRVHACKVGAGHERTERVGATLQAEEAGGLFDMAAYADFARGIIEVKCDLLAFLIDARRAGKTVVGYGAPAKGNTMLNYCGIQSDLLAYTVDLSPHKQGLLLPGSRIPVHAPDRILETRPDYVLILPWNLRDEIAGQMAAIRQWGGRFVTAIPDLSVF